MLLSSCVVVFAGCLSRQTPAGHLPVDFGRLTNDDAREAWHGVISPDGHTYVYQVVYGHDRQLWALDLATRKSHLLTSGPPENRDREAWSPDSKWVAFTDQGDGAIHVVGVDGGPDRLLLEGEPDNPRVRYVPRLTWPSDSEVVVWYYQDSSGGTVERPHRRLSLSGSKTNLTFEAEPRADEGTVSPGGRWIASYATCCGGAQRALWIRDAVRDTSYCAAGPFQAVGELLWLGDSASALLIVDDGKHEGQEIYAVPMTGGAARRLIGFPMSRKRVSLSRTGTLAVVTASRFDSIGRLWLTTLPARTDPADTLGHCPDPQPRIMQFVRASQLHGVRSVTEFGSVPAAHFALFTVVYGPMEDWDIYPSKSGVVYRDHIGWLSRPGDTATTAFHIPPGDRVMFSEKLDRAMGASAKRWRAWLAMQPDIPKDAIIRLAIADSDAALSRLANNPSVHTADLPVSALAKLGARGPQYARFVIAATRLGNDADAVADLARLPRYRFNPSVQGAAQTRLRALAPAVLANRKARESTVFELVCGNIGYGWTLDFTRHPAARRSIRILTVLAAATWPQQPAAEARQMLAARGVTVEDGVLGLLDASRADSLPPYVLDLLENVSSLVQRSYSLQRAMSLMSGRYAPLRLRARQALAHSAATPDSVLLSLARTVDRQHEGMLLFELAHNKHAMADPEVVATLRAQGIAVP